MILVQDLADLILAIHYMPAGWLWAEKLSLRTVALAGILSSVLKLWELMRRRPSSATPP